MNKKGEGSRGGVVIGHTRSGKPIYESGNKKHGFNKKDHLDAALAHAKKKAQAWQALKNMSEKTEIAQKYRKKFNEHKKQEKFHTEETNNMKKGNMDINKEMDRLAENMEKSNKSEVELLIDTIKAQGYENIKKAIPHLDDIQLEVLNKALTALNKAKATPMDADYVAPRKDVGIHTRKVEEEFKDDDADEKLVKEKNKKIDHQGDSTPKGKDSNDVKVKKSEEEVESEDIEKGRGPDKQPRKRRGKQTISQQEADPARHSKKMKMYEESGATEPGFKDKDPKEVKEKKEKLYAELGDKKLEKKCDVKKSEEQEDIKEQTTDKVVEKDENMSKSDTSEAKKPVKEEKLEKSINWTPRNLLSVGQGERNFNISVNDFYSETIKKAEEAEKEAENIEKSKKESDSKEKLSIDEMIKKGLDQSKEELEREEIKKADKERSYSPTNFSIDDMISLLNLKKDEAADILKD